MKTRTSFGLVFGVALLGSLPLSSFAESSQLPTAASPSPTVPAPHPGASTALNSPETAAVNPVAQPLKRLPDGLSLSGWVTELVKIAESGIDQGVLFSFIDSAGTFNLGADQIIYLHDVGISSDLITAMIQHDAEIAAGVRPAPLAAPPSTAASLIPPLPTSVAPTHPVATSEASPPAEQEEEPFYVADLFDDSSFPEDETRELSPVRKPYAEQLTSPIVIYRIQGRIPNLTLLQTLP